MKKLTKLLILLICITLLSGCTKDEEEFKYKIHLYNINEVDSILVDSNEQNEDSIEIIDQTKMKVIYYMFEGKKSNEKSVDEKPRNTDKLYTVTFVTEKNKRSLYMYMKDDGYYIEETDGGLYKSNKEDFEKLKESLKEDEHKYKLENFELENIVSVKINTMGQYDDVITFNDEKTIGVLYNIFSDKKSNIQSTNYNPNNPEVLYQINFYNSEEIDGATKAFYIYKKHDKYYIEESMKAIYNVTESEFNIVDNYVKVELAKQEQAKKEKEAQETKEEKK